MRLFSRKYKHLLRYQTIVKALARNGLGFAMEELNDKRREWFHPEAEVHEKKKLASRIRSTLEQLGPTFIKLGQIASTRPDILPADIVSELQKLQDHVSPFPYSQVVRLLESELHAPISSLFQSFSEEPLAAASIGQVHRAVLKSGESVIVKVQRPNIQKTIEADLEILAEWARISESRLAWAKHYRLYDVVEQFSQALLKELNYLEEARNAEKLKVLNQLSYVYIPHIYWDFTSRRVLTMEYVQGIPFSEPHRLSEEGMDQKQLANRFVTALFSQILDNGLFHADPHPGNVMALPDGKLAFLDFGMVGKLSQPLKDHFVSFVIALRNQSTRGVIRAISRMGVVPDEVDEVQLFADVDELRQKYYQVPLDQVSVGVAVQDLFQVAYRHRIRIPSEMTMLGKALLTMEGVSTSLDSTIRVMDIAEPFGKKLLMDRLHPFEIGKKVMEEIPDFIDLITDMPTSFKQFTKVMQKGKVRVEVESPQIGELLKRMDRIINRLSISLVMLSLSIVMLGLIVGAAISGTTSSIIENFPVIQLGFIIAMLMFIWLIFSIYRSGK